MSKKLLGIGMAVVAVALTAGLTAAQSADAVDDQGQGTMRGQGAQPPGGQGQMGPGQMGQGQMGPGQRPGGPGQFGPGQGRAGRGGFGPGRGMGQGRGRGGRAGVGGPGAGLGMMLGARLDLTDDQQAKIQALQRANRDQAAAVQDELELARRALHREAFADTRDTAKVTALATKVTELEKELFDSHLKTQTAIADLLTPEQRETMRLSGGGRGRGRGPGVPAQRPAR